MNTSTGFTNPVVTAGTATTVTGPRMGTFSMNLSPGVCFETGGTIGSLTANGLMSGWCGLSSGDGVTNSGGRFAWIGAGGLLVMTGALNGMLNLVPDTLAGHSCHNNAGASQFIVAMGGLRLHCVKTFPHTGTLLLTIPIPATWTLPTPFFHIHTNPWHIWVKTCLYTPIL